VKGSPKKMARNDLQPQIVSRKPQRLKPRAF